MARAGIKTEADLKKLVGWKCVKGVSKLLAHLHEHHDCPNRELHYDQYAALLLFYFFNSTVTSLRDIKRLTEFKKFRRKLGVKCTSLGSLSEASQVFDPELLHGIFKNLAAKAAATDAPRRPKDFPADLDLIARDGTVFQALPRMVWALWLRKEHNGVRVHLDFDILRGTPVGAEITTGNTCEKAQLKKHLQKGRLYVYDRGLADYELFQKVIDAGSSFVGRVQQNAVFKIVEERPVTTEGAAAGVQFDRVVELGGKVSGAKLSRTVRIVKAIVKNEPTKSLKFPRKRVASTKTFRTSSDTHELLLVTDRFDLPAELVVLLYKYRWHVELFFKWLKCVMGCRHLVAESEDGVKMQVYAALIAGLLIVLWTGKKPTKATYQVLQFYFLGWVSDDELKEQLGRLKKS